MAEPISMAEAYSASPQDGVCVQMLFQAIRNLKGVDEGPKITRPFTDGSYDDDAVIQRCWEVLIATRATQREGPLAPTSAHSKFERYGTFEERFNQVVEVLWKSKSICKQILAPSFIHRLVDQPLAELKQKSSNREINARKSQHNKIGQQALALGMVNENGQLEGGVSRPRIHKRRRTGQDVDGNETDDEDDKEDDTYHPPMTRSMTHLSPVLEERIESGNTFSHLQQQTMSPFFVPFEQHFPSPLPEMKSEFTAQPCDSSNRNMSPFFVPFEQNFATHLHNAKNEPDLLGETDFNFDFDFGNSGLDYGQSSLYHGIDPQLLNMEFPDTPLYHHQSSTNRTSDVVPFPSSDEAKDHPFEQLVIRDP